MNVLALPNPRILRRVFLREDFWLLAAANFWFCQSLFHSGLPRTHEGNSYLYRVWAIARCLAEGQWDARWIGEFAHGYGYPLFNFYAPGLYYAAALFRGLGFSYLLSVKCATVAACCLGGWGAWLLGRRFWGSRRAAYWTSMLFVFFPYRACNLNIRGDFSELAAICLIPWALWAFDGAMRRPSVRRIVAAAAWFAAIVYAHNTTALSFAAFLPLYLLAQWIAAAGPRYWRAASAAALAAIGGLALSAAFWLPALAEKGFTHAEIMFKPGSHFDAAENLLSLAMLFDHDWRDYDASAKVTATALMAHGLGWPAWIGIFGALAAAFLPFATRSSCRWRRRVFAVGVLLALVLLSMLQISRPFWVHVPLARTLQFPWRLLGLAGAMSALMGGGLAHRLAPLVCRAAPRLRRDARIALTIAIALWALPTLRPFHYIYPQDREIEDAILYHFRTTSVLNEFLPLSSPLVLQFDDSNSPRGGDLIAVAGPGAGSARIESAGEARSHLRRWRVNLRDAASMGFGQFLFPGWQARANGEPVELRPSKDGLTLFDLPAGEFDLELRFADTPVRAAGEWISLLALIAALLAACARPVRRAFACPNKDDS